MAASKKFGSATEFEAWIDKAQELTETEDTFKALKAITPALEAEWNNKACDIEVSNGKLKLLCKDRNVLAEQPIVCGCDGTTTEKNADGSVTVKGLKDVNTLETYNLWIGTYDAYTKIASRSTNTIYGIKQDGGVAVCKAIHAEKDKKGRDIPTTYATQTGTYDSMTVGNATKAADVTTNINGKKIADIFESDGTTVKKATSAGTCTGNAATATRATDADNADKAKTAGGADKLNEEITITIKDNSGTYSGAGVSFNGSKDITLKLPATAKMDITGNAATATTATTANTAGSCGKYVHYITITNLAFDTYNYEGEVRFCIFTTSKNKIATLVDVAEGLAYSFDHNYSVDVPKIMASGVVKIKAGEYKPITYVTSYEVGNTGNKLHIGYWKDVTGETQNTVISGTVTDTVIAL